MRRLTFEVSSSRYIASQVLRQVAKDHRLQYPETANLVKINFYVDNLITGASTTKEAVKLCSELNSLLKEAQMTLQKWRSSFSTILDTPPDELKRKRMVYTLLQTLFLEQLL